MKFWPTFIPAKLDWYLARIRAMDLAEILHRIREFERRRSGRRLDIGWQLPSVTSPRIEPYQRTQAFLSGLDVQTEQLARETLAAIDGESFRLLGVNFRSAFPPSPDFWTRDSEGKAWPGADIYCFKTSYRHGVGAGEIKTLWELNRLQFLPVMAALATRDANVELAARVVAIINSWMEGNPPYRGPNWVSQIEVALRAISVFMAASLIAAHLDGKTKRNLAAFGLAHAAWIRRFPSLHSSANNHRVAELAGLLAITAFLPEIRQREQIEQDSWGEICELILAQIHSDGVSAEQAPAYTAFAVELFLTGAVLGRPGQAGVPEAVKIRLAQWAQAMRWMMDDGGNIPDIGDRDDCRVIATPLGLERQYVASVTAAVAGFIRRPDLAPPFLPPHLRNGLFEARGPERPLPEGARSFTAGGVTVLRRTAPSGGHDILVFDHGPHGYLSIAAHAHADALAIWLTLADKAVFVDAGTFLYHSDRWWRDRFRATSAHNTLTLAGEEQSVPAGPFNWRSKACCTLIETASTESFRVSASHDGYKARFGVRHRRDIDWIDPATIVIRDRLEEAASPLAVEMGFLLAPELSAHLESNTVFISAGDTLLRLEAPRLATVRLVRGDEISGAGWVAPLFGERQPATRILFDLMLDSEPVVTRLVIGRRPHRRM